MEVRKNIKFLILKINKNDISNFVYIKILTDKSVETIKLNTNINKYKSNHLLKPNYLLTADLIKTRKNWILKDIINFEEFVKLKLFKDFERYIEIINILNSYLKEGAQYPGLIFKIQNYINQIGFKNITISDFDLFILRSQGFIDEDIRQGKDANHM